MFLPFFAQIVKEAIKDLGHGEEGGAKVPSKTVDPAFRDFTA
jgi:hypothetical protein